MNDTAYIKVLAFEYELPSLDFIRACEKGVSSYNAILGTRDGRRFFVKQYKDDDAERRENSNLVERYVANHSPTPVVLPIETRTGDSHVYIDEKMYTLFEYREHSDVEPVSAENRLKQVFNLAQTLGVIHSIPVGGVPVEMKVVGRWNIDEVARSVVHLDFIKKTIQEKDNQDDFDALALRIINEREDMLSVMNPSERIVVQNSICHTDYHIHNVLFDSGMKVIGVIDWDACGLSDSYVDFLNTFMMTVVDMKYDACGQDGHEEATTFMQGYLSGINFVFDTDRLKNAVNVLAQVMVGSSWPLDEHYFMSYSKADSHFESEWLKEKNFGQNQDEVVSFILGVLNEVRSEGEVFSKK